MADALLTKFDAYWLDPKGEIHPVKQNHITFIRDNLKLFKMTQEEYFETYDKYGEKRGFEGKAREEILINAMKRGWIRIRNYGNKGWSVEVWELSEYERNNIFTWATKVLGIDEAGEKYSTVMIHIIQLEKAGKPQMKWLITTTMKDIVKGSIFENRTFKNKHIKTLEEYINSNENNN